MRLLAALADDHARLQHLLATLATPAGTAEHRRTLDDLHFELDEHRRAEDDDLLALLDRTEAKETVDAAREDYEQLEQLLAELDDCLPKPEQFADRLQDLERALAAHAELIESRVFGAANDLLTPAQLSQAGRRIVAEAEQLSPPHDKSLTH